MKHKLFLALAVAAGFVGGVLSQYIFTASIYAQSQTKEIAAQRFVLKTEAGSNAGIIAIDQTDGQPNIVLFDEKGRVLWSARGRRLQPLSER
jgi:hypothetical protein